MLDFSAKKFLLVSNFHTYGIQHAMYNYLRRKDAKKILFLNHPLHGVAEDYRTTLDVSTGEKTVVFQRKNYGEAVNYAADFYHTMRIGLREGKTDVFVGFNSMNTIAGILLKWLGQTTFVITYSHSYKKNRYKNPILNTAYTLLDRFAIRFSDSVWGLSSVLGEIRKSQGVPKEKVVVAADGVDTSLIKPGIFAPARKYRLVFLGLVNKMNGVDLIIEALPLIIKKSPRVTVDIIGIGDELPAVRKKSKKYGLTDRITFYGIMSIEELATHLPKCGIGLAPYLPSDDSTIKTTDPMKTKLYMAAGLPVVSTDAYASSHEIKNMKLGRLIDYNKKMLADAVLALLDDKEYKACRENCISFVKKYDWEEIFTQAFSKALK